MRRHERTSRPLGSEAFVEKVGVLIGGDLRQKKPGRKVRSRGTSVGGHQSGDIIPIAVMNPLHLQFPSFRYAADLCIRFRRLPAPSW